MKTELEISDVVIWFKHLPAADLVSRLDGLEPEAEIVLQINEVVGSWRRMKTGKDGRLTRGIRPVGRMQPIWQGWYETRKGERVTVQEVTLADDYLSASTALFSEWSEPEDEAAFSDL